MRSYFERVEGWHEFAEWQLRKDIEKLYGRELPDIIIRENHGIRIPTPA